MGDNRCRKTARLAFCAVSASLLLISCSPYSALRHDPERYVHGTTTPDFSEVRQAFVENFTKRKEIGAACAVYWRGEKVVDLWGGFRDGKNRLPWEENTLVTMFSTSKGISAITLALLHSRGLFRYDDPVSRYWPEFARNGKQDITIRQLLSHEAGLCALDTALSIPAVGDSGVMTRLLARQKPAWTPGVRHGYHAVTLGWYENELVRRIDPGRRTIGRIVREDLCAPLGIDFYIGLPDSVPMERCARLVPGSVCEAIFSGDAMPPALRRGLMRKKSIVYRSFFNPKVKLDIFNERPALRLEIPSANGTGTARATARIYSLLADSRRTVIDSATRALIDAPHRRPDSGDVDIIFGVPVFFSLGFMKPFPGFIFGGPSAAGHPGLGGSFAFADPGTRVAYAYVPNRLGFYPWNDPRDKALRNALERCLQKLEKKEDHAGTKKREDRP